MVQTVKIRSIGTRLAAAFLIESEEELINFVKGYFIGRLGKVSPAMLAGAVDKNTKLWEGLPQGYKNLVHNIGKAKVARNALHKYSARITLEEMLKWMQAERPDLCSVILNWPDGSARKWLEDNMNDIKGQLLAAADQSVGGALQVKSQIQVQRSPPPM